MGYTKDQLLARLEELQISFACYDHPVVLTVEAQAKYVGHLGGGLSKNLFLKDKKNRFYIVSAMVGTTVDLKVLSQRLGLGKGGLRMAPEEALKEILQVPLGCVTPFALVNDSARNVSLLLDQGFKTQGCCLFHPLSNDVTISLNAQELDRFLISIGKKPSYIDLEANPSVGKDQPPDLATLVPSGVIVLPDQPEEAISCQVPSVNQVTKQNNSTVVKAKAVKQTDHAQSFKKLDYDAHPSNSLTNVGKLVEEIIDRTSDVMISEISKDSIQHHGEQLGTVLSDSIRKRLTLELESLVTMFKNSAYTEGFHAAIHYQPKSPFHQ